MPQKYGNPSITNPLCNVAPTWITVHGHMLKSPPQNNVLSLVGKFESTKVVQAKQKPGVIVMSHRNVARQ